MQRAIRLIWSGLAAIVLIPVAGGFFAELAKDLGLYEHPGDRIGALVSWLPNVTGHPWYALGAGIVIGGAAGMWLDSTLSFRETGGYIPRGPHHIRTHLRLQFLGGGKQPLELSHSNLAKWYSLGRLVVEIRPGQPPTERVVGWQIFIVFDVPVALRQVHVSSATNIPRHEVRDYGTRHAIVVFDDDVPPSIVDIEALLFDQVGPDSKA